MKDKAQIYGLNRIVEGTPHTFHDPLNLYFHLIKMLKKSRLQACLLEMKVTACGYLSDPDAFLSSCFKIEHLNFVTLKEDHK